MKELFYQYFSGKASKEEVKWIMDYVDSSDAARREFLCERKLWDAYTLHGDLDTGKHAAKKRQPVYIPLLKIAAALVLALTIGWAGWYLGGNNEGLMQTIHVRPGSCVELTLADGSRVWLNANTEFSYPSAFGKKQRAVTLSGEGYFEVAHSKSPFIVHTAKYDVEVMGTTFNVDAYPDEEVFTTSLLEGSVKVRMGNNAGGDILLQPNEYVSLGGDKIQRGTLVDQNHFLWRNGILYFDDEPFPDMIKMLEKHYHLRIEIKTPEVMNYRCTGKFRQAEGIDHILRVLQVDLNFKYQRMDDNQTIVVK